MDIIYVTWGRQLSCFVCHFQTCFVLFDILCMDGWYIAMMGTRNYSSRANVHGCVHACRPMFIELASNISQPTSTESILVFDELCIFGVNFAQLAGYGLDWMSLHSRREMKEKKKFVCTSTNSTSSKVNNLVSL
jgi:hypothetical protein